MATFGMNFIVVRSIYTTHDCTPFVSCHRHFLSFPQATKTKYQLASGHQRKLDIFDPEALFEAFGQLVDFDDADLMIRLPIEGWHRIAFINTEALDYVMLPTHRVEQGGIERPPRGFSIRCSTD